MDELKIIELKQGIFAANEVNADIIRAESARDGMLMINVMSSPGSGKTTTLVRTIKALRDEMNIGILECDIDASVDAETVAAAGARAIQLHTGGMCHMDAGMTKQGLIEMGTEGLDLVFIENIGNLVCPAEFDTGAQLNVTILSVPEGDDKPAKYPLVYEVSDLVIVNKIDALAVFDFDKELVCEHIRALNPKAEIIFLSSKTGEGFEQWTEWLKRRVSEVKEAAKNA